VRGRNYITGGQRAIAGKDSLCALLSGGKVTCGLTGTSWQFYSKFVCRDSAGGGSWRITCSAGAGYQALLRNPLAEPYLLGISNGAAVGTMLALVFFGSVEWSRPVMRLRSIDRVAGCLSVWPGRTGASPERYDLSGVIVTTFLSPQSFSSRL